MTSPQFAVRSPAVPRKGTLGYGLGFLAYIPIPFVGMLVAAIAMAGVYSAARKQGGVAAENARRAANWGLTVLAVMALLVVSFIVLLNVFNGSTGFFPIGLPVIGFLLLSVVHVIVCIMGLVIGNRGDVFENALAIPFYSADTPAAVPAATPAS